MRKLFLYGLTSISSSHDLAPILCSVRTKWGGGVKGDNLLLVLVAGKRLHVLAILDSPKCNADRNRSKMSELALPR